MPKIIPVEQGSPEWHHLRKNKIGASCAPILMGESTFGMTPYKLWQQMLGLIPPQVENDAMRRGKELEKDALELYTSIANCPDLFGHVVESEEAPFMIASFDGISDDLKYAIEIKCLRYEKHLEAYKGHVPPEYIGQLQQQMFVANLQCIHYVSYSPDADRPIIVIAVKRDDNYIAKLLGKAHQFWHCLQTLTEPEKTDKDYEQWQDNSIYNGKEFMLIQLDEQIDKLTKEKEEIRQFLIEEAQGRNILGKHTRLTHSVCKGTVNYKSIPQLEGVDLDAHRGKPIKKTTITRLKNG
jgi:putative phage-type endonuclease